MLEPDSGLACRLAVAGDGLDIGYEETDTRYAITWQRHYRIEAGVFIYEEIRLRRRVTIAGYPPLLLRKIADPPQ